MLRWLLATTALLAALSVGTVDPALQLDQLDESSIMISRK